MDLKKGKIYIIKSNQTDNVYIGATTATLNTRLSQHKYDFKHYGGDGKRSYATSFEIVKYPDCYIELHSEHITLIDMN